MEILVTGATGGIGRPLLEALRSTGTRLRALTRSSSLAKGSNEESDLRWVSGDLTGSSGLTEAVEGVEIILHMAAATHSSRPRVYEQVNVEGTRRLIEAATKARVRRFIHVSTRAIGANGGAYSASKERAEAVVRGAKLPFVILRPSEVYGGGRRDPVLGLVRQLQNGRVFVLGDGSMRLSPVWVGDIIDALVAAVSAPAAEGRTYTLAGPESLTFLELLKRLEDFLDVPSRMRVHVPLTLARLGIRAASLLRLGPYVPDQIPRLLLDKENNIEPAARDLGYDPRPLEQGLSLALGRSAESA